MYCVRVKTIGISDFDYEYFIKRDKRGVLTVPNPHYAADFASAESAVQTVNDLKKIGVEAEVVNRQDEILRPLPRTSKRVEVASEFAWLVPLLQKSADGRTFLRANQQTVFGKDAAEVVEKIIALADCFDQWRGWLAANEPIPQPVAPPAPPPVYAVVIRGRDDVWRYKLSNVSLADAEEAARAARAGGLDPHDVQVVRVEGR